MYVHAEAYIDEAALAEWCKDNGYDDWDGYGLDVLTDYLAENASQMDVVKIL